MKIENPPERILFSVDLEPNKDDTLNGVRDAMQWYDSTLPKGTVFTTRRIATEMPDLVEELSGSHEIGVHVHPREFGHDHDQLAELPKERQRELIIETMEKISEVTGRTPASFRAGRHSVSKETIDILMNLGFSVDASVNIRYGKYLSRKIVEQKGPFELGGIEEIPVTYQSLPVLSRCGLRGYLAGPITATAATLRADQWGCSGKSAMKLLFEQSSIISYYMHPYDATDHHNLENSGAEYRQRVESIIDAVKQTHTDFDLYSKNNPQQ